MESFTHLFTHRYLTTLPGSLSKQAHREGFLLRIEWNGLCGYADLMAWPELGDLTIEEELLSLLRNQPTDLAKNALKMAWSDALARSEDRSLWTHTPEPPRSHYLAGDFGDLKNLDYPRIASQGFASIKVKWPQKQSDTSFDEALEILSLKNPDFHQNRLRLRIDWNGRASPQALHSWLKKLSSETRSMIEFLEDPFPKEDLAYWQELKSSFPEIPLFVDRADASDERLLELADGWVLKPALQDLESLQEKAHGKKISYTQYLGHALGAAWAAWSAAKHWGGTCVDSGLIYSSKTEGESSFFSDAIACSSSAFSTHVLRQGLGIGWTESDFNSLTWSPWR